ncbi:MAG TPA: hypothetical protein VHA33_09650 [Candidatus Angelobacter sp.]|nr:hypothetical protein [Candidatus Angelobacter sp.]
MRKGSKQIACLFSHKHGEEATAIGGSLKGLLTEHGVRLDIDSFPMGINVNTRMQTFDIEAVIFLACPESISSVAVQLELNAALRQRIPIFTIHLRGELSQEFTKRTYWHMPALDSPEFVAGGHELGRLIYERVSLHRKIRAIHSDSFSEEMREAAEDIATKADRTLVAEYACELAGKYLEITDPSTRFWIALALGKASTPEAAQLLEKLPRDGHPLEAEGIRQAQEMYR